MDKQDGQTPYHAQSAEAVMKLFNSSQNGLEHSQLPKLRQRFGKNQLVQKRGDGFLIILLRQLNNPLIYILLAATLLSVAMEKYTDALVVFAVIVINTIIGFIQEYQAENTIQALMQLAPEKVRVLRQGEEALIDAAELVPGDFLLLQAGDKIPADCRIFMSRNATINESILTGESLPVEKYEHTVDPSSPLAERRVKNWSSITQG